MGSSSDGSAVTQDASSGLTADPLQSEPSQGKGFFGRILSAFSPNNDGGELASGPMGALSGLAALSKLQVDDVAIPKADIVSVPLDISLEALVAVFRAHGFSRLPVYSGSLDHPQGLILLKDLALGHGFGAALPAEDGGETAASGFNLKALLRPILFAPPSMPASVLLQKMQKERVHMALVIDEYGGVDGLVTIEDLIETVIGEIDDEHDEVEGPLWHEEAPGVVIAQSVAPLEEIEAALGCQLRHEDEDQEIDTVGGLVFLRMGRVPAQGEVLTLEGGIAIEIIDADARRIKGLRLRLPGLSPLAPGEARAEETD